MGPEQQCGHRMKRQECVSFGVKENSNKKNRKNPWCADLSPIACSVGGSEQAIQLPGTQVHLLANRIEQQDFIVGSQQRFRKFASANSPEQHLTHWLEENSKYLRKDKKGKDSHEETTRYFKDQRACAVGLQEQQGFPGLYVNKLQRYVQDEAGRMPWVLCAILGGPGEDPRTLYHS